jgi:hypothetical protein
MRGGPLISVSSTVAGEAYGSPTRAVTLEMNAMEARAWQQSGGWGSAEIHRTAEFA